MVQGKIRSRGLLALVVALLSLTRAAADDDGFLGLQNLDLGVESESGDFSLQISGLLDLEGYVVDEESPGLLLSDHAFINPRLTLFLDVQYGEHWSLFSQVRADRGLDPDDHTAQVRPDEYFVRYSTGAEEWSTSVQVGKFATPLGNFVPRHDSFHNPLVRAPLPYDHMTSVGDKSAPPRNQVQINRRELEDRKELWVPVLWGPVYHTGGMAFARWGEVDARVAVTNSAPSERPEEWTWQDGDIRNLAWSARVGWRAFPGFGVGLNWARGPYYRAEAEDSLRGADRSDFDQKLVGVDLEYKVGAWEFFAEVFASEWEAPGIEGNLRALAYYVESKFTITPRAHVAARWNQIFFNALDGADGRPTEWDRAAWRAELGAGYLLDSNLLGKLQFEHNEHVGGREPQDDLWSMSLTLSF